MAGSFLSPEKKRYLSSKQDKAHAPDILQFPWDELEGVYPVDGNFKDCVRLVEKRCIPARITHSTINEEFVSITSFTSKTLKDMHAECIEVAGHPDTTLKWELFYEFVADRIDLFLFEVRNLEV